MRATVAALLQATHCLLGGASAAPWQALGSV